MNVEYFIAKRLFTAKEKNNRYTRPILRIAILAIALSVAVMLLSMVVLAGFKTDISNKIIGFGSHITITNYTNNQSYETEPISVDQKFYPDIIHKPGVNHIQVFATKAGIIKTESDISGMLLKGVGDDFNISFFEQHLLEGDVPIYSDSLISNKIMLSSNVAKKLKLKIGDDVVVYFFQEPTRVRKFILSAIYETGFVDFDDLIMMVDIKHIQKLNNWINQEVGGFEILIDDFSKLEEVTASIYSDIPYNLNAESIKDKNPHLFDWLDLQNINLRVILILMLIVGSVNMITALLILILERTKLVGVLKALGCTNWSVRKVFLYNASYLIINGMILGNIIGLGLAFIQHKFHLISLDPNIYYMTTVPIKFNFIHIFGLNLGVLLICLLVLILPSFVITKITPIRAIRFS